MRGTIIVEIDTSVFDDPSDTNSTGEDNLHLAVKEGLRARIDTIDPITERRYVNLLFTDQDGNKSITQGKRYASIPTLHPLDDTIMTGVTHFVEKINRLPIGALVDSLQTLITQSHEPVANANRVLKELQATMEDIHTLTQKNTFTHMPDEIDKTLKTLTDTLKTTQKVVQGYSHTSLLSHQVSETLKTVKETSDEMKKFLEMLNRKPNSLIFGDH
jgi:paraquat-inducible protein B